MLAHTLGKEVRTGSCGQHGVPSDMKLMQADILRIINLKPGIKCSLGALV